MRILILSVAVLGIAVSGCATQGHYEWNQSDQRMYDYYKSPSAADTYVSVMEPHVRGLEAAGKKPAPGLYAELGTFYMKRGDTATAVSYYKKEMLAWPESKAFMTALIANASKTTAEVRP